MNRSASIQRDTSETQIAVTLDLDGKGESEISTGIGFFDHMLVLFAKHGLFNLIIKATGDLHVDFHHTVEDTGIALGKAFQSALGDKTGIVRYGTAYIPMDEALARIVVDISGRPFLNCEVNIDLPPAGAFPLQLIEEFLRAFSVNAGLTLHASVLSGRNSHHICEAIFKGLGRALDMATLHDPRVFGVPSTKGIL